MTAFDAAILTTSEMAQADGLAIAGGVPGIDLMEEAGAAVAGIAAAMHPDFPIHVLCGPGNNGGDGFVAARRLGAEGRAVQLFLLGDREDLKGDAAKASATWMGHVHGLSEWVAEDDSIVIDALFGAGLARPLAGEAAEVVAKLNESEALVVAVDVPSGLDGNTGKALGDALFADETVTFFRPKPGHFLYPGRSYCGDLTVADIGIPASVLETIRPLTRFNDPALWLEVFPFPSETGHKYARGHALVLSGDALHTGAARMAAYGALRAGAGLVTLAGSRRALEVHANHVTAVMLAEAETDEDITHILTDPRKNAVIAGPALGVDEHSKASVIAVLRAMKATVLDADALTSFADAPQELFDLLHDRCVLTPHEGEFERLFPGLLENAPDRLVAARSAAATSGAIVLLKGPGTIVAAPDGRAAISANAPPFLATAGSGDVLAGIIGGLLAQGMPPFEAAAAAVWIHGEAGSEGGIGLIAEDLPGLIPNVIGNITLL